MVVVSSAGLKIETRKIGFDPIYKEETGKKGRVLLQSVIAVIKVCINSRGAVYGK